MQLQDVIVSWYQDNKRMLPWRKDKNPYHVWISEIMLQQTRIEAVKDYYFRFMERIPDIASLAAIEEDELLKLWQGLGYYNRARNLKKAALIILNDYQGIFPSEYEEIRRLPGIGEYTAGAIASICFQKKVTAIDGNVLRVYSRYINSSENIDDIKVRKQIQKQLLNIIPIQSGDFNEGLMELGETICLPNAMPLCEECPLRLTCEAYLQKTQMCIPVRNEKQAKNVKNYTLIVLFWRGKIGLHKRTASLLHNLWEFPNIEGKVSKSELLRRYPLYQYCGKISSYQHIFTHQVWYLTGFVFEIDYPIDDYVWVTLQQLEEKYALPTAFQPVLKCIKEDFASYLKIDETSF